jgi:hypothetical protein
MIPRALVRGCAGALSRLEHTDPCHGSAGRSRDAPSWSAHQSRGGAQERPARCQMYFFLSRPVGDHCYNNEIPDNTAEALFFYLGVYYLLVTITLLITELLGTERKTEDTYSRYLYLV